MPERLADHTTLHLGGPADEYVVATTEAELTAAVSAADAAGRSVLVLGGGSNLVVADEGFGGIVIEVATTGVESDLSDPGEPSCGGVLVTAAAGETWDDLVARAVEAEWSGIEALSGIPGRVGAAPIQNVGAYGQEVSQTIWQVRVWDRKLRGVRTFANADCRFGYRHSRFKAEPGRHVVLSVTFQLRRGDLGAPIAYAQLAAALGVEPGVRVAARDVREAVLALRRSKGMVIDSKSADDHDTWSAGSFFTNPVVEAGRVPDGAPAYPQPDGTMKTSAAWLIERAGFGRGYGAETYEGRVSLSTKHTLALTNRGRGTTADLLALAREVRGGVRERFGIELVNEPVLVGVSL